MKKRMLDIFFIVLYSTLFLAFFYTEGQLDRRSILALLLAVSAALIPLG